MPRRHLLALRSTTYLDGTGASWTPKMLFTFAPLCDPDRALSREELTRERKYVNCRWCLDDLGGWMELGRG